MQHNGWLSPFAYEGLIDLTGRVKDTYSDGPYSSQTCCPELDDTVRQSLQLDLTRMDSNPDTGPDPNEPVAVIYMFRPLFLRPSRRYMTG